MIQSGCIFGITVSDRQENATVNEGPGDQEFTVGSHVINLTANENPVNVKTLERYFNERIFRELNIIVDTVEDGIENAVLTQNRISNKRVFWTRCDQCHCNFRMWGTHRDYCPF